MRAVAAGAAGVLFSIGLALGGMTDPENIVGFLDLFGDWKPALMFVMAGAVGVYAPLYWLVTKRRSPLFAPTFELPASKKVDAPLLVGSAVFGIGWGIGGFCPGPALTVLGAAAPEALVFVAAMSAGMLAARRNKPQSADSCG